MYRRKNSGNKNSGNKNSRNNLEISFISNTEKRKYGRKKNNKYRQSG